MQVQELLQNADRLVGQQVEVSGNLYCQDAKHENGIFLASESFSHQRISLDYDFLAFHRLTRSIFLAPEIDLDLKHRITLMGTLAHRSDYTKGLLLADIALIDGLLTLDTRFIDPKCSINYKAHIYGEENANKKVETQITLIFSNMDPAVLPYLTSGGDLHHYISKTVSISGKLESGYGIEIDEMHQIKRSPLHYRIKNPAYSPSHIYLLSDLHTALLSYFKKSDPDDNTTQSVLIDGKLKYQQAEEDIIDGTMLLEIYSIENIYQIEIHDTYNYQN